LHRSFAGHARPFAGQGKLGFDDHARSFRSGRRAQNAAVTVDHADEIRGINSRSELAELERIVRQTKNEELMAAGVTLIDPATTYVEPDVIIGADTVLHPNVYLDISGIPPNTLLTYFPRLEEISRKTLFGTDWPGPGVPDVKQNLDDFNALPISREMREQILSKTAASLWP